MNAIERIQAAIEKLEALKAQATGGEWWKSGLEVFAGPGLSADYLVVENARLRADAELIVTLHRTIDAQLAVLRSGLEWLYEFELEAPTYADGRSMSATRLFKVTSQGRATFALADAILGGD